nr:DUF262 domain-containing protein [Clostridium sp. Marseille-P7770]
MKRKVIEEAVSVESYLSDIANETISDNQDVQRNFCSTEEFEDGIVLTVLSGEYLPSLIIGEISVGGITKKYLIDGMQRTSALRRFKNGAHKIRKKCEDSVVEYQKKKVDKNGVVVRDENGEPVWEIATFDVKGKGYKDLPEELKREFDKFQVKLATLTGYKTMAEISKKIRQFNMNTGMNTAQKSFTYLDMYARKVKTIGSKGFFKESTALKSKQNDKGACESMILRSIMTVFHLDSYKKNAKDVAVFLNTNASDAEFNLFQTIADSLCNVVGDAYKALFTQKNVPIWFAAYNHFLESGIEEVKFRKFLDAFQENLHMSPVECDYESKDLDGEITWDKLDGMRGTTDNGLVKAKIEVLCQLIDEFFDIKKVEKTETEPDTEENSNVPEAETADPVLKFVQENVREAIKSEDIELYKDFLDDYIKDGSPIYNAGEEVVIALMAYATDMEKDSEFSEWIDKENSKNNTYSSNHKTNFTYLKRDFDAFLERENGGKAA